MSILKRISATLVSHVDQLVGEIENHEAVIRVGLDDLRKQIAAARVRLRQLQRERERLQSQVQEHLSQAQRWRERALQCAQTDERRALECMRRSKREAELARQLERSVERYIESAARLMRDVEASEQRLAEGKQKLALLRAREAGTGARSSADRLRSDQHTVLEESFERWEINLEHADLGLEDIADSDLLEEEFRSEEEQQALRAELEAMLRGGDQA